MTTVDTEADTSPPKADTVPDTKKQKMGVPESPDNEWPEAWYMPDEVAEQCQDNKLEPNKPVSAADLKGLGISYWKMDADAYEYPVKEVPWNPKDAQDPRLKALRDDRGYSYADIITVHPDHLPDFENKIKCFFEGELITAILEHFIACVVLY